MVYLDHRTQNKQENIHESFVQSNQNVTLRRAHIRSVSVLTQEAHGL